jgi:hypothetical protein
LHQLDLNLHLFSRLDVPNDSNADWHRQLPAKGGISFCACGPLEPWFDMSWKPGELELAE